MASARLSVVLSSGYLNKRSKILDSWGNTSLQSKTKMEMFEEEAKLTDLFDLSILNASLYATILEDTIMEIQILDSCNNTLQIMKSKFDMGLLLANKFSIAQPLLPDELAGIDHTSLWKEEYKLNKLAKDRNLFYNTILGTYLDLSLNRSFESLAHQIAEFESRTNNYTGLIEEDATLRIARRDLSKQLRSKRIQMTSANYDMDVISNNLKSEVEDAGLNAETRTRYITLWERARTEQHLQKIKDSEDPPSANITIEKQKLENEHRVHSEVMLLGNLAINETMAKVENMMDKYDKDIEQIELKIQIMKNNYQSELDKRTGLEELIAKHEIEVKDWVHFKEEREKARQYVIKMTKAAITAQAWWRGLMVRLQLGPFKPTKKRGMTAAKEKKK